MVNIAKLLALFVNIEVISNEKENSIKLNTLDILKYFSDDRLNIHAYNNWKNDIGEFRNVLVDELVNFMEIVTTG